MDPLSNGQTVRAYARTLADAQGTYIDDDDLVLTSEPATIDAVLELKRLLETTAPVTHVDLDDEDQVTDGDRDRVLLELATYREHASWRCAHPPHYHLTDPPADGRCPCGLDALEQRARDLGITLDT
jgi:hypothetical protein